VPSLVCSALSFSWPDGDQAFSSLDVAFPDGLTGLVGRNGVGKSTLLRVLAGELTPTSGTVSGASRIGYLPQQLVLHLGRSVADLLGVAGRLVALERVVAGNGSPEDLDLVADDWDLPERVAAALADVGLASLDLDRTVASLSGGETVLLALAGLFLARPQVLLLDEPTNNLDRPARARLYRALQRWRGPVIVVSHDLELLDLVDHVAEMRDGDVRIFGGNFTAFTEALAVEQEAAQRGVRSAQGDLRRQQRELAEARLKLDRRLRYARGQADNVPKIVAGMKKRAAQVSAGKLRNGHEADVRRARAELEAAEERVRDDDLIRIDLSATAVPSGRDIVVLDDVELRTGRRVSLHLRGPERVALTGSNGSGKTTLIETLCGLLPPVQGRVDVRVPVRLLPQRLQLLPDADTVLQAVSSFAPGADDNTLRAQLARFLLDAATVTRPVGTLSGGERFRATLAALLLSRPAPQLLVLDEPTNNLDLDSVAQLVAALRFYQGALLVASHDEPFLAELALDRRIHLGEEPAGPDSDAELSATDRRDF
jgi:ATPase subunit of ABC transporter with duplicated ATPase domains